MSLRVIAGSAGGRRLVAPKGSARPTTDRVREALFASLGHRIDGATVLDLYAGSGALAIEALSRGATRAVLVDRDHAAEVAILTNLGAVGFTAEARFQRSAVSAFVAGPVPEAPFDLVFLDPPYDTPTPEVTAVLDGPGGGRSGRPGGHGGGRAPEGGGDAGRARRLEDREGARLRRYAPLGRDHLRSGPPSSHRSSCCVATALCPGSFDPVTNGHLDIIERTARHFDDVIVAVIRNPQKTASLFTLEERQAMLTDELAHVTNVRIEFFKGLLVEFAKEHGAESIVKGLRAVSDFDYELQMAQMNQQLSGIDTFFISTSPQYSFLSSSLVREVARFGGDVSGMVPDKVAVRLRERFAEQVGGGAKDE